MSQGNGSTVPADVRAFMLEQSLQRKSSRAIAAELAARGTPYTRTTVATIVRPLANKRAFRQFDGFDEPLVVVLRDMLESTERGRSLMRAAGAREIQWRE